MHTHSHTHTHTHSHTHSHTHTHARTHTHRHTHTHAHTLTHTHKHTHSHTHTHTHTHTTRNETPTERHFSLQRERRSYGAELNELSPDVGDFRTYKCKAGYTDVIVGVCPNPCLRVWSPELSCRFRVGAFERNLVSDFVKMYSHTICYLHILGSRAVCIHFIVCWLLRRIQCHDANKQRIMNQQKKHLLSWHLLARLCSNINSC
jgi:hypothetical protein